MSECYRCGRAFERLQKVAVTIPLCVSCQPKQVAPKLTMKFETEYLGVRPPSRRFHVTYRQSNGMAEDVGFFSEKDLRAILWGGEGLTLEQKGNGPAARLTGNYFWTEVP